MPGPETMPRSKRRSGLPIGDTTAVYSLFYDAFNDWFAREDTVRDAGRPGRVTEVEEQQQQSDDRLAETIAEFAGDVIWPLFSQASRAAVQTAYIAQLRQMILDGIRSTDRRIPVRDLRVLDRQPQPWLLPHVRGSCTPWPAIRTRGFALAPTVFAFDRSCSWRPRCS